MRVDCGTLKRREAPGPGNLPPTLSTSLAPWPRTIFISKTVRLFLQQTRAKQVRSSTRTNSVPDNSNRL